MNIKHPNVLFSHSGGVTSVVNTVASTLFTLTQQNNQALYISSQGILGLWGKAYLKGSQIDDAEWALINRSPASSFGSSRINLATSEHDIHKMFEQFEKYKIGTFICNGGNGSQAITHQLQKLATKNHYPLNCIGIPKTIDNDLHHTDTCPGYGSAAKYTATSLAEICLDVASMCHSSTQVLIYEAMGRDAGWLAAASVLAKTHPAAGPHIILLPEASFSLDAVLEETKSCIQKYNHCVICIAEGALDSEKLLSEHSTNHVAFALSDYIHKHLNTKNHVVIPDYLQRSARHLVSSTDLKQTVDLTKYAYQLAQSNQSGIMTTLVRDQHSPYKWHTDHVDLALVANKIRNIPKHFISENQMFVTKECIQHIAPLIIGEEKAHYQDGIPKYSQFIYQQLLLDRDKTHD